MLFNSPQAWHSSYNIQLSDPAYSRNTSKSYLAGVTEEIFFDMLALLNFSENSSLQSHIVISLYKAYISVHTPHSYTRPVRGSYGV